MTGSHVEVSESVTLVPIDIERDAPIAHKWLMGEEGQRTLYAMGVIDAHNHPSTVDAERTRLHAIIDDPAEIAWMIRMQQTIVGIVEVHIDDHEYLPSPAVHIMLGNANARGKGLGSQVLSRVCDWLYTTRGQELLYSRVRTDNHASARMLARVGFIRDGAIYQDQDGLEWQNMTYHIVSHK